MWCGERSVQSAHTSHIDHSKNHTSTDTMSLVGASVLNKRLQQFRSVPGAEPTPQRSQLSNCTLTKVGYSYRGGLSFFQRIYREHLLLFPLNLAAALVAVGFSFFEDVQSLQPLTISTDVLPNPTGRSSPTCCCSCWFTSDRKWVSQGGIKPRLQSFGAHQLLISRLAFWMSSVFTFCSSKLSQF